MEDASPEQQPRQLLPILVVAFGALVVLAAVAGIAVLVSGIVGDDSSDVGSGNVARVETVSPISQRDFDHWYPIVGRSIGAGGTSAPSPDPDSPAGKPAKQRTMEFLINARWIDAEAKARGIVANDAEIARSFAQTKRQSFPKQAAYRKFLKQSGQSKSDLLVRVRTSLLATKLRISPGQGSGAERLKKQWRARTVCASGYVVPDCGNS